MKGAVKEVTKSKSGKAWRVQIGEQWYGAGFDSNIENAKGKTIDFEYEDGKFGLWVKSWSYANGSAQASVATDNGGNHEGLTEAEMRFVSNCVGQAILAKTITDPLQIAQWAKGARQVLKELA